MAYETAVSLGVVLSAFIMVYIGTKIQGKGYAILQPLFLIITIFILFSHLAILSIIADNESQAEIQQIIQGIETVYLWIGIFIIAYYIMLVFIALIKNMGGKKKKKREKFDNMFSE